MHFKIYRTHTENAELEEELKIDIPTSSVDEFSNFYKSFSDYLTQPDISIGVVDLKSAEYLRYSKPRKAVLTDKIKEEILKYQEEDLTPFQVTVALYNKYGIEFPEKMIKEEWSVNSGLTSAVIEELTSDKEDTLTTEDTVPF